MSFQYPLRQSTLISSTPLFCVCSLSPLPLLACAGGGGSSRTGVSNCIGLHTAEYARAGDETEVHRLDTGERICTSLAAAHLGGTTLLASCTGDVCTVHSVACPTPSSAVVLELASFACSPDGAGVNCCAFLALPSSKAKPPRLLLAAGAEAGQLAVFELSQPIGGEPLTVAALPPLAGAHGGQPVCSLAWVPGGAPGGAPSLVSGGKDGCVRVHSLGVDSLGAASLAPLACIPVAIPPPRAVPGARPENARQKELNKQVMVRCVAVNPTTGYLYAVSSGRRGASYLHKFQLPAAPLPAPPRPLSETVINPDYPSSSLCLLPSPPAPPGSPPHPPHTILCAAGVDGTVSSWIDLHSPAAPLAIFTGDPSSPSAGGGLLGPPPRAFAECHDLPVTAMCACPAGADVVSVSADAKVVRVKVFGTSVAKPLLGGAACWLLMFLALVGAMYAKVVSEAHCPHVPVSDVVGHGECLVEAMKAAVGGGAKGLLEPFERLLGTTGSL
ncbi:hypothetical protein TeGR_g6872 [Tetraparma gracilis]|uniref:Uncharacterized protein n=1 Tax=Tetraparma gracilis TaxID=2962635 RepID=A0ABQ6ML72_9STRA|nr:hypothetical protein TeGR_g6872 [Tetraparma gracilis]